MTGLDRFSLGKQFTHVGDARIAFCDQGAGPPVVLLHGCPFSSFVWRNIIPAVAAAGHRCLAPDPDLLVWVTPRPARRRLVAASAGRYGPGLARRPRP